MASQSMDSFLGALAQGAAGALTGKGLAQKEHDDNEQQQTDSANRLFAARMKIQADQDADIRKNAFTYAQKLQDSLTPTTARWMQDNHWLEQHKRETQNAMDVVAGRVPASQWHPQFAFEEPGGPATSALPNGSAPPPASASAPALPPAPVMPQGLSPKLGGPLGGGAGTAGPFGPQPPIPPAVIPPPAAPAPNPRQNFTPTEEQDITRQTTAESLRAGAALRAKQEADRILDAKKFNLEVASKQITDYMDNARFREGVGKDAVTVPLGMWTTLFNAAVEMAKESAKQTGGNPAAILRSVLHTSTGLFGTVENKSALHAYVKLNRQALIDSGLDPKEIDKIETDASMGIDPTQMPGTGTGAAGGTGGTARGGAARGAGGGVQQPGGPPALPAVDPGTTTDGVQGVGGTATDPNAMTPAQLQALQERSRGLGNRGAGSSRGVALPPGAVTLPNARPGEAHVAPIANARPGEARVEPLRQPRLAGSVRALQQVGQMEPKAKAAAQAGFKALQDAGVAFTVNSTYRTAGEQAKMVRDKKAGKNPNPVAPVGHSTHQAGIALDLSNTNGTQEQMARILEPLGWKWAGPKDPPHFTYVGAAGQPGGGPPTAAQVVRAERSAPTASRGAGSSRGAAQGLAVAPISGTGAATGGTAPPADQPVTPPTPTPGEALNSSLKAVGIKSPAAAAAVVNPYPEGSLDSLTWLALRSGQQDEESLLQHYAGQPDKQRVISAVARRVLDMQQGNMMPNLPRPSLMGAELPTKEGIGSLGNLMYSEPGVGMPNVTTEPVENTPLTGRVTERIGEASRETLAPEKPKGKDKDTKKPFTMAPITDSSGGGRIDGPLTSDSGGGGVVPQPGATDGGGGARKATAKSSAKAPGKDPLAVPPPPSGTASPLDPDRGVLGARSGPGGPSVMGGERPQGKAAFISAGRGPVIAGLSPEEQQRILSQDAALQKKFGTSGAGTRMAAQMSRIVGHRISYNPRTGAIIDPTTGTELHRGQPHGNAGSSSAPGSMASGPPVTGVPPRESAKNIPAPATPTAYQNFRPIADPAALKNVRAEISRYRKNSFGPGIERWFQKNGINDPFDRRFYFVWANEKFIPELQRRGHADREIAAHLDHYLAAHQARGAGTREASR